MASPTIHASAVLVGARAVLIQGPPGSGKSRLALALVQAALAGALPFARLVGDDRVHIEAAHGRLLVRPAAALAGRIEVGIGIATGPAFVGNIRAADLLIWSAVGNTTNLAARLQALTPELAAAIAVDAATRVGAGPVCADFERHPDVPIRGRSEPSEVWALPARAARPGAVDDRSRV